MAEHLARGITGNGMRSGICPLVGVPVETRYNAVSTTAVYAHVLYLRTVVACLRHVRASEPG